MVSQIVVDPRFLEEQRQKREARAARFRAEAEAAAASPPVQKPRRIAWVSRGPLYCRKPPLPGCRGRNWLASRHLCL